MQKELFGTVVQNWYPTKVLNVGYWLLALLQCPLQMQEGVNLVVRAEE